jgi:putative membrane protein
MIALPPVVSAAAILLAGLPALLVLQLGPASSHMMAHIGLMSLLAPLAAVLVTRFAAVRPGRSFLLWLMTGAQLALLLALHAPGAPSAGMLPAFLPGALLLAAVGFWVTLVDAARRAPWQAIFALLVTSKLACLLGALLIFAPRVVLTGSHGGPSLDMADQQLAGLLMVTACPLSYLTAGVVLAAQTITALERRSAPGPGRRFVRHRPA